MSPFLQQAWTGRSEWGVPLIGIGIVVIGTVVGGVALVGVVTWILGIDPAAGASAEGVERAVYIGTVLLPFVAALGALGFVVVTIHRRPLHSIVTASDAVDWGRVAEAAALWAGLGAATTGVAIAMNPGNYTVTFEPVAFGTLVAMTIVLVPIQAATEELLVRGYLMQTLARWTTSGLAAVVGTSAVFAVLHVQNPEVASFGFDLMMAYYAGFGLLLGVLTLMDDGCELAIGVHVANNLFGVWVVTFPESALRAPAILTMETIRPTIQFGGWAAGLVVFGALIWWRSGWTVARLRDRLGRVEGASDEISVDRA